MPSSITTRLLDYARLMRLDKPIGIFLLLWPTLWALLIASEGQPDQKVLLIFVLGVVLMRSAGCVINDYADRDIDCHVSRTRNRPLASGRVSTREAKILFLVLSLAAFVLVLQLNRLTILLSIGGVLLAAIYPFMKRVTHLPQVVLGAAFGWSVPMAFAAQTGTVPQIAWLMFLATLLWATVYDTMYAMVDIEDDLALGVKSTAILFGDYDRIMIAVFQILFLLALVLVGRDLEFSGVYYLGLGFAGLLLGYEQFLIADRNPAHCFAAFLHNHWVGAVIFIGIMGHYYSI